MEIAPIYKRVIGLDVHQAKISACALIELADGTVTVDYWRMQASDSTCWSRIFMARRDGRGSKP